MLNTRIYKTTRWCHKTTLGRGLLTAMDPLSVVVLAVIAVAVAAFLYWLYSFAVAPFCVLSRLGIRGPPPIPYYGNQKVILEAGRLAFFANMLQKYGDVFG